LAGPFALGEPVPKIILTRGLPASGKTEWATRWVAENPTKRLNVNRDDLRKTLYNSGKSPLSYEQEQVITTAQQSIVKGALAKGFDVVVSDNNLASKYVREWYKCGDVEVKDFEAPLDELLRRDAQRADPVGEQVIRDRWKRFTRNGKLPDLPPKPEPVRGETYVPNRSLPSAWLFDVDGTLAHINEDNPRDPYDGSRAHEDDVDRAVRRLAQRLNKVGDRIVIMSGRDSTHQHITERWLDDHYIPYQEIHMRPEGDRRPDDVIKLELFNEHIRHRFNVLGVIDDRLRVVRMWHRIGVPLFRVGDPDASF